MFAPALPLPPVRDGVRMTCLESRPDRTNGMSMNSLAHARLRIIEAHREKPTRPVDVGGGGRPIAAEDIRRAEDRVDPRSDPVPPDDALQLVDGGDLPITVAGEEGIVQP